VPFHDQLKLLLRMSKNHVFLLLHSHHKDYTKSISGSAKQLRIPWEHWLDRCDCLHWGIYRKTKRSEKNYNWKKLGRNRDMTRYKKHIAIEESESKHIVQCCKRKKSNWRERKGRKELTDWRENEKKKPVRKRYQWIESIPINKIIIKLLIKLYICKTN